MLLLGVVFALVTIGFVAPCLLDIARTPQRDFDLPSKGTWLLVVVVFWALGAAAWLLVGRRDLRARRLWYDTAGNQPPGQQWAVRRHPAGRGPDDGGFALTGATGGRRPAAPPARFIAPDDNQDFLVELDRRIREWRDDAGS
jgi:hypothetical protein